MGKLTPSGGNTPRWAVGCDQREETRRKDRRIKDSIVCNFRDVVSKGDAKMFFLIVTLDRLHNELNKQHMKKHILPVMAD